MPVKRQKFSEDNLTGELNLHTTGHHFTQTELGAAAAATAVVEAQEASNNNNNNNNNNNEGTTKPVLQRTRSQSKLENWPKNTPKAIVFDFDLTVTRTHTGGYTYDEYMVLDGKIEDQYSLVTTIKNNPELALKPGFLDFLHQLNTNGTKIIFASVGSKENVENCVIKAYKKKFGESAPLDIAIYARETKVKSKDDAKAAGEEQNKIDESNKGTLFAKISKDLYDRYNISDYETLVADDSHPKLREAARQGMACVGLTSKESKAEDAAKAIQQTNAFLNEELFSPKAFKDALNYAEMRKDERLRANTGRGYITTNKW